MDIVTSGSGSARRVKFTLGPRYESRPVSGLAPELTKEQAATLVAVSTGVRGLGEAPADKGFPLLPLVVYGVLAGLVVGTMRARRG